MARLAFGVWRSAFRVCRCGEAVEPCLACEADAVQRLPMWVNLRKLCDRRPTREGRCLSGSLWCFACLLLAGRSRIPARRESVYNCGHSITLDRVCRGLREPRIARTRSLPALGPPDSRRSSLPTRKSSRKWTKRQMRLLLPTIQRDEVRFRRFCIASRIKLFSPGSRNSFA